jgi:hypothetical protein
MLKKILVFTFILLVFSQGVAFASSGEVVIENIAYGAVIGGALGGAWYLLDDDDFGHKVGTGLGLGIIAGFIVGVTDASSVAEIENNTIKFGVPPVLIEKMGKDSVCSVSLLKVRF